MRILGLDLSKSSTGYALWGPGDVDIISGRWVLGDGDTSEGAAFCELHRFMSELHEKREINVIYVEAALTVSQLAGHTNITTLKVLAGLNAHAKSWGVAMGCRIIKEVNQKTWRKSFLGTVPPTTRSIRLKEMAQLRCRQLGFKPYWDDEAEAIGVLTHACLDLKITPYWLANEVLRPELLGDVR